MKLKNEDVLLLVDKLTTAMRATTGNRLKKMDIARDLVRLKHEKGVIDESFEFSKPAGYDELLKESQQLFSASAQRIRAQMEATLKAADPELKKEDIDKTIDVYEVMRLAEAEIQQSWARYSEFEAAQAQFLKAKREVLKSDSDFELTAVIEESDLLEDASFEDIAVLAYFFKEEKE